MKPRAKKLMLTKAITCALALAFLPAGASAVCNNGVVADEQALWNVHNCWTAFRDWFRPYFNLQSSHWDGGWGWTSCDPTQAFPKMWNSAYLITYGLRDSTLGPWHSDADYYRWASGNVHGFRYEPEDVIENYATAFAGWLTTDRVEMECLGFNNLTAGGRAAVMLHESTHIIYGDAFGVWHHQSNPPGSNCTSNCSDDWFFHYLNSYPYGSLAGNRHSMVQIQIEWLCDLGEFSEWWVPFLIASTTSSQANSLMTNRIRNPPGWTCGLPRPIYVPPPPPPPSECGEIGTFCSADDECCSFTCDGFVCSL